MANLNTQLVLMTSIILMSPLINMCLAQGFGIGAGLGFGFGFLTSNFYDSSCPQVNDIIMSVLQNVVAEDPRMAASLLRLHFHDCFVKGCDASVLLDDTPSFMSEKNAVPNANSLRGFEVIDEIKARLEQVCPDTVSCADILTLAARDSVVLSGGPTWEVPLGRKDSTSAYFDLANNTIPAPVFNVPLLLQNFQARGLDAVDLVALSGGHTMGLAQCKNFKKRLYNQYGNNQQDTTLEMTFLNELRAQCPPSGGKDTQLFPLDYVTPKAFDNSYFNLILQGKGLLFSDQQLYSSNFPIVSQLVRVYAQDESLFFRDFARSMVKMGNLSPLLGSGGQVRKNCRYVNYY